MPQDTEVGGIAAERLRSIVERIERLEEERKALAADIKDVYAEAKSAGFEMQPLRQLIQLRKKKPAEVEEQETLLDLYKRAGDVMTPSRYTADDIAARMLQTAKLCGADAATLIAASARLLGAVCEQAAPGRGQELAIAASADVMAALRAARAGMAFRDAGLGSLMPPIRTSDP